MTRKKRWILISSVLVILIIGLIFWFQKGESLDGLQKETVTKGDLKKTISITGSLISESPVSLNFENAGRIQSINVKIGDKVIEGQILAVLNNNVLNEQVKKAKAALDKAMLSDQMNNDSAREALEKVDNSEDYLEAVEEYHDQLVNAAEITFENASDYRQDVESYYEQIVDDSGLNSTEAKGVLLTLTTANNSEEMAKEALETAKKNRDLNIISAENSLDVAEESLETIKSNYAESSRTAAVIAAQADYQIALKSLENSSLKASLNGVISKINYEQGEILGSASLGEPFGEMITNDFILKADIPESDISDLKLGQIAEVIFDAFDYNEKFVAKVVEIEPASTKIQDVTYYKAKLKIEGNNVKFKEGMSADIDVLINDQKDLLKVSNQFIFEKGGKEIVLVVENGNLVEKEIKTGLVGDDGYVEVLSGLEAGDEVYFKEEE